MTTHVPLKPVIVTTPNDNVHGPDTVITVGSPEVAVATGVKLDAIGAEAGTPLNMMVWASFATVTPYEGDVAALNTASAALVAVMAHEPVPWVMMTFPTSIPEPMAHAVEAPASKVTAPVPLPPATTIGRRSRYTPLDGDTTVNAA